MTRRPDDRGATGCSRSSTRSAATAQAHTRTRGSTSSATARRNQWFNDTIGKDFSRAEWTAVPLALGILLVAFGACSPPCSRSGSRSRRSWPPTACWPLISHRMHLDTSTSSVMLLVGLAVGVDYCMFYLRREREERARGRDPATALRIAAATSGRSVLVSGLTVVVAMSGMFLSGMLLFDGFAIAAILVVLVAVLGSVTVLPALLSLLGDRVDFGRVPGLARMRRPGDGSRVWGAILGRVLAPARRSRRWPPPAFLLVLAAPGVGIHTEKLSLDKLLPADTPASCRATTASPRPSPAARPRPTWSSRRATSAAAHDDRGGRRLQAARPGHRPGARADPGHHVTPTSDVIEISVPLAGNGTDATSVRALRRAARGRRPATLGRVPGAQAYVAGNLAFSAGLQRPAAAAIVPVFALRPGAGLPADAGRVPLGDRSPPCPSLLNVLSMAAAFGVMVAVFQHGWGAGLVGARGVGAIESWIPLFAFVILFGLSMDYHVFVVSRIREAHDRGLPTREAVAHGIRISAGVVTSAAVIMVAVFAVFATLSMTTFKQLGVGLAVAILLDATVVRAVLLPSVLSLLGDRTWWLPALAVLPARPLQSRSCAEPTRSRAGRRRARVGPSGRHLVTQPGQLGQPGQARSRVASRAARSASSSSGDPPCSGGMRAGLRATRSDQALMSGSEPNDVGVAHAEDVHPWPSRPACCRTTTAGTAGSSRSSSSRVAST